MKIRNFVRIWNKAERSGFLQKMNIEGKEEYGNLRKLYDGAKAERNEYFRMYSELLNENKDLKKSYENFVKAKNAQYLRKRKTSSQKDVDALNLKLEKARACISDLEARTSLFIKRAFTLRSGLTFILLAWRQKRCFRYRDWHCRWTWESVPGHFRIYRAKAKGWASCLWKEKAKMEYQYANIEYVD